MAVIKILAGKDGKRNKIMKVVPGLEPGFPEGDAASKSEVITSTPHNHDNYMDALCNNILSFAALFTVSTCVVRPYGIFRRVH